MKKKEQVWTFSVASDFVDNVCNWHWLLSLGKACVDTSSTSQQWSDKENNQSSTFIVCAKRDELVGKCRRLHAKFYAQYQ
jgi:hypothetical protein